jgi:hypothetical protein
MAVKMDSMAHSTAVKMDSQMVDEMVDKMAVKMDSLMVV